MIETPAEWIEMAWAARDCAAAAMNVQRRAWFDGVKALMLERDLPPSVIHPNFHITRLAKAR